MREFVEIILPSGIKLYHYQADFPVSSFEIMLPIGSAHAGLTPDIPNGAPHFLEHLQMLRSELFSEKGSLERMVGLEGGYDNAHTGDMWTSYELTVPTDAVAVTFAGLCDRVFRPIFAEIDFENQWQIIENESEHKRRFFPGSSPSAHYYSTQFLYDVPLTLERIFGTKDSGNSLEVVQAIHRAAARAPEVVIFSAGPHSVQLMEESLANLPSRELYAPPSHVEEVRWVRPQYHEVSLDDVSQPTLEVAWIKERSSYAERVGIMFLFDLWCNSVHGHIYQILRHEKGWVYDVDWYFMNRPNQQLYGMTFPVMDVLIIQHIRDQLLDWMKESLADQEAVEREIHRRFRRKVTWYETAVGSIETEVDVYRIEGRHISHAEWEAAITAMGDVVYRTKLFETFFSKDSFGEMAFLPAP